MRLGGTGAVPSVSPETRTTPATAGRLWSSLHSLRNTRVLSVACVRQEIPEGSVRGCFGGRLGGALLVTFGGGVTGGRVGSVLQLALSFRFFFLLFLQLFAALFAGVIYSGHGLSLWFLGRLGGVRRVLLLRCAGSFALLLRLLFLVRLRRFVAHVASTSVVPTRCQRAANGRRPPEGAAGGTGAVPSVSHETRTTPATAGRLWSSLQRARFSASGRLLAFPINTGDAGSGRG